MLFLVDLDGSVVAFLPGMPLARAREALAEAGVEGAGRAMVVREQDGLGTALARAAQRSGSSLVLARLADGAHTPGELRELLAWTAREGVRLRVLDIGLDGDSCTDVPA